VDRSSGSGPEGRGFESLHAHITFQASKAAVFWGLCLLWIFNKILPFANELVGTVKGSIEFRS
jgi:hypothetical protein